MKNIGLLFGAESSFPIALINFINTHNSNISASIISIGAIKNTDKIPFDIIYDRISHYVPMYKSYLKMAAYNGVKVINNPNSNCYENNFFHSVYATKNNLNIPKAVLLPSKELPSGVNSEHLHNLIYPINWDEVFNYIGFPAILKSNIAYNLYNEYEIYNQSEFFSAYDITGNNPMILQEYIDYDYYYRVFNIDKNNIRIVSYNPSKPIHLRYDKIQTKTNNILAKELAKISTQIANFFDIYFNSSEFAIKDNKPYIINFLNPAPKIDKELMYEEDFDWLVEQTGNMLVNL